MRIEKGHIYIDEGEWVAFIHSNGTRHPQQPGPTYWSEDSGTPNGGGWKWEIGKTGYVSEGDSGPDAIEVFLRATEAKQSPPAE